MPKIVFEATPAGHSKELDVQGSGALVDAADEVLAPVPFSCRSATCGTCISRILKGSELLEPPNEDEAELLALMGADADVRLVCQARFRAGPGTIRVRALAAESSPVLGADDDE